ncbi:hypothetical protein T12_15913 [Trichinella patagoniensis]|uniref:Uncharacterized protein n=1 Tax=Trichinella patagoniensis TaxID=990121 RepID=A0A0V1AFQ8_9BILA|nr:hypothetical protein T12_15913 [Trichinella patagoniensis]
MAHGRDVTERLLPGHQSLMESCAYFHSIGKEVATFLHAVRRVSRHKAVCSTALRSL